MHMAAVDGGERTESLFAAIGAFLDAHGLSPDPAHYAFAHAALTDPAIASAVDRLTDGGIRLNRREIESLGGSVRSGAPEPELVEHRRAAALVAQTQAQVDEFAHLMHDLRQETIGFGRDLAESAAAISRQPAIAGLDEIARITGAMTSRVRDAEARLASATAETESLRTELAHAQEEARRDPLTGLPNRLAFEEAYARAAAAAGPVCLAVADIDHFKQLNDRHGHGVGDRVLAAIARGLAESCPGQFVARHGGEEFALIVTGAALPAATALLEGAREALADRRFRDRETGEALGRITLSAGVVELTNTELIDVALARADRLLYAAKADGRDCVRAG